MTGKKTNVKNWIILTFIAVEAVIYVTFNVFAAMGLPDPIWIKYAGVLLCLAVLTVFLFMSGRGWDNLIMFAALLFTAVSDLFIFVLDKYYEIGLVTFIIVQSLYLYRLYAYRIKKIFITLCVRFAVMAAVIITFAAMGMLNLLVAECAIYIIMLVANTVDGFIICRHGAKNMLFAIGLALFLCCDICVGLYNFGSVLSVELPIGLIQFVSIAMWAFYLPSQVLITLSADSGGLRIKGVKDVAQG